MSSSAADNEFLRLLGGGHAEAENSRLDKRVQYTFIGISFYTVVVGALGIAAGYSAEHCMTYFYGYANVILALLFFAMAVSFKVLSNNVEDDFMKECHS